MPDADLRLALRCGLLVLSVPNLDRAEIVDGVLRYDAGIAPRDRGLAVLRLLRAAGFR